MVESERPADDSSPAGEPEKDIEEQITTIFNPTGKTEGAKGAAPEEGRGEMSQAEQDVLLAAVDGGEITLEDKLPQKKLSFQKVKGEIGHSRDDFGKEIDNKLQYSGFADKVGELLERFSGLDVDVSLLTVECLNNAETIMSLPSPTAYRLFRVGNYTGILEMNPSAFFPLMSRSEGIVEIPNESSLYRRRHREDWVKISSEILAAYKGDIGLDITEGEVQDKPPLFGGAFRPQGHVLLASFEISLGEDAGMMNIANPFIPLILKGTPFEKTEGQKVADIFYSGLAKESLVRVANSDVLIEVDLGKAVGNIRDRGTYFHLERDPSFVDVYANGMFVGTGFLEHSRDESILTLVDLGQQYSHDEKKLMTDAPLALDARLRKNIKFKDFYRLQTGSRLDLESSVYVSLHGKQLGRTELDMHEGYGPCIANTDINAAVFGRVEIEEKPK